MYKKEEKIVQELSELSCKELEALIKTISDNAVEEVKNKEKSKYLLDDTNYLLF